MRAAGAGRGESGLMVTGAFDGRVLVDELGAWTQQSKMEAEGRKEADSAPILINGVFSAVPDAGLRTAAPSLGPNVGISKSSWDDLAPGLARRETVSSVEEVEKSRRRAGPWRQTKGRTKPLGGRRPRPPRVHHHRALRPGPPPSARAGQPNGAVSKSPKMLGRAVQGAPRRPNATEERRIGRSAHQFFFFAGLTWLCQSATLAKPWDRQRPRSRSRLPFQPRKCQAAGMPSLGPFVCQQQKKGRVMAFWAWHGLSISPRP